MPKPKKVLVFTAVSLLIVVILGAYAFMPHGKRLTEIEINFPSHHLSNADLQSFLAGDFTIVRDMRRLPAPVLQAYTERGSSRLLMANPGERFEATDAIIDSSPRKRLIFAAVSRDRCIVSYEQGGYAPTFEIKLFSLHSKLFSLHSNKAEAVWQGYCRANNLEDLRREVAKGSCKNFGE